jgi:hypothetical protein
MQMQDGLDSENETEGVALARHFVGELVLHIETFEKAGCPRGDLRTRF